MSNILQYLQQQKPGVDPKQELVDLMRQYLDKVKAGPKGRFGLPLPPEDDGWACGAYDFICELQYAIKS